MTVKIKQNASKTEVATQLKKIKPAKVKGFNASKHFGTVKWEQDPLEFQREIRGD